jgi:probable phosphoglycerate mutase
MTTYLIRHGRTVLSSQYLVNGDPGVPVKLDATGRRQCRQLSTAPWIPQLSTCVASEFGRCRETARLVLAGRGPAPLVEPGLNEIGYGVFEGGPWMTYGGWLRTADPNDGPDGGGESRRAAISRMLGGLARCLELPGPRLVVAHGLLVSVLLRLRDGGPVDEWNLPEAPYVTPLAFDDPSLRRLIAEGLTCSAR